MIIGDYCRITFIHLKDEGEGRSTIPHFVSVLGSCCLGKSPKLGEVLSCYSLWRSGANPVASVNGHRGSKGLLPITLPIHPIIGSLRLGYLF